VRLEGSRENRVNGGSQAGVERENVRRETKRKGDVLWRRNPFFIPLDETLEQLSYSIGKVLFLVRTSVNPEAA
jgi:hypothetical protein